MWVPEIFRRTKAGVFLDRYCEYRDAFSVGASTQPVARHATGAMRTGVTSLLGAVRSSRNGAHMPLPSAARILRPRTVRLVGWIALAFAGLTITAGIAHADDAPEGTVTGAEAAGSVTRADSAEPADAPSPLPTATDAPAPAHGAADATASPEATDGGPATSAETPTTAPGTPANQPADAEDAPTPEETTPVDPTGTPEPSGPAAANESTIVPEGDTPAAEDATPADDLSGGEEDPVAEDAAPATEQPPVTEGTTGDADSNPSPESPAATATTPRPAAAPTASPSTFTPIERRVTTAAAKRTGFTDVPANLMYADEILWMQRQGYATGWPDVTYRPLEDINRDAFMAMIYRVHAPNGYTAPSRNRFVDVPTNSLYYREISWAAQQGITTGWSDGTFRPLDPID